MRGLLALLLVGGCAWQDGRPMGELTAWFEARWAPIEDRDVGDGWQRLASDFEVRVEIADAELVGLALVDTGTAALSFDPADPPAGYTLCHAGHCHADDGRLVPYEEIAAELGGDEPAEVLRFELGARDLLASDPELLDCGGACDLPRADIGRVDVELAALHLEGLVRDTRDPPRVDGEVAWTLDFAPPEPQAVLGRFELPVDRGHPPVIELDVDLVLSAAILDDLAFDALPTDATEALSLALAEVELDLGVERN